MVTARNDSERMAHGEEDRSKVGTAPSCEPESSRSEVVEERATGRSFLLSAGKLLDIQWTCDTIFITLSNLSTSSTRPQQAALPSNDGATRTVAMRQQQPDFQRRRSPI